MEKLEAESRKKIDPASCEGRKEEEKKTNRESKKRKGREIKDEEMKKGEELEKDCEILVSS